MVTLRWDHYSLFIDTVFLFVFFPYCSLALSWRTTTTTTFHIQQVHEFGHALMTKRLGGNVDGIVLWPLGGFALCGPTDDFLVGDLKVALAGPMTHIPMTLLWWAIYVGVKGEDSGLWPSTTIYLDMLSTSVAGWVGGGVSVSIHMVQSILADLQFISTAFSNAYPRNQCTWTLSYFASTYSSPVRAPISHIWLMLLIQTKYVHSSYA